MQKKFQWISAAKQNSETNNRGFALIIALSIITAVLLLSVGVISYSVFEYKTSNKNVSNLQAFSLAEAGLQKAIQKLNDDPSYRGETNTSLSPGAYTIIVTQNGNNFVINSSGYIPDYQNYKSKKSLRIGLSSSTQNVSFNYALQAGVDGIEMRSNSSISGNAYSNGAITGASNSAINGDAFAVGSISSPKPVVTGQKVEGTSPSDMPTIDYDYWKNQANINNDPYTGNLILGGISEIGPKKIIGNLTIDTGATITLKGPLYITGNIELKSNSRIILDSGFGSMGTVIISDGTIVLNSNSQIVNTTATPKGYILLVSLSNANPAILVDSNISGGIFYCLEGVLKLNSNNHIVTAAAKKILLESNSNVEYDTGLASTQFSGGPGGGLVLQKGSWQEIK